MSRSTRRNLFIALVFALCAGAGFGYMIFQIDSLGGELEKQIAALEEQNKQQTALLRLRRIADESVTERTALSSYFLLQESDSIDFLNKIEALAPDIGVTLQTEGLRQVTNGDNGDWIEANFSVIGGRARVEHFVELLEVAPYVSKVTRVDLTARADGQWQGDIIMQVRVLAYGE